MALCPSSELLGYCQPSARGLVEFLLCKAVPAADYRAPQLSCPAGDTAQACVTANSLLTRAAQLAYKFRLRALQSSHKDHSDA